jgi:hypothetical protein
LENSSLFSQWISDLTRLLKNSYGPARAEKYCNAFLHIRQGVQAI